jgi:16S rRNA (adenine1518-N6/adenine1519-N6)-dimethyltransferase
VVRGGARPPLPGRAGELEASFAARLRVIEGMRWRSTRRRSVPGAHVVANLPYNVGTALLVRWLGGEQWPPWWRSLTLMFQREVAERIVAAPDTDHYGRLAVLAQWRSSARLAMKVHRSAFVPPPKVMSAVVHLVPAEQPVGVRAQTLERLTAAAFGQRRKMLRRSLAGLPGALDALGVLGIDSERRAETLSVAEFTAIARVLDA